jgi:hypothetical protein
VGIDLSVGNNGKRGAMDYGIGPEDDELTDENIHELDLP